MLKENELLRNLMSQPLSVYFDAYRTEVIRSLCVELVINLNIRITMLEARNI